MKRITYPGFIISLVFASIILITAFIFFLSYPG